MEEEPGGISPADSHLALPRPVQPTVNVNKAHMISAPSFHKVASCLCVLTDAWEISLAIGWAAVMSWHFVTIPGELTELNE